MGKLRKKKSVKSLLNMTDFHVERVIRFRWLYTRDSLP